MFCLSAEIARRIFPVAMILVCAALLLAGCGAKSGSGSAPGQPVTISVQPLSQTVPIGQTATFSVTAIGAPPISYQWSENGTTIAGATSASYTTPIVELGSGGSTMVGTFQVAVSNASSSATSHSATLTAGPRSPKAGDLRYLLFSQVDLPGLLQATSNGGVSARVPGDIVSEWADNAVGTPLGLGSSYVCQGGACAWPFFYSVLPTPMAGFNMYYQGGEYSSFISDLKSFAASDLVFMSWDLEPAEGFYAVSWVQTTQPGGFDYRLDPPVPAGANQQAQIQAQATLDGTGSRVVTATSFDASGNAYLISYGWTGDTTTVYETQTNIVPHDDVCSTATTMAGQGYIISAFGGNDVNGYILIGMRVQGDTLPRPIEGSTFTGPPYYTAVVYLLAPGNTCAINEQ
jgi:hypothetical protein